MPYTKWPQVFQLAVKMAKGIRAKNPKITVAQSTKMAFKTPEVMKARKEYEAHKAKKGKAEGGATKRRRPAAKKRRT